MKTLTPRIEKAIDIFLDAIIDGTLESLDCTACAVGNLVAHGLGGEIIKDGDYFKCNKENTHWYGLIAGGSIYMEYMNDKAQSNIDATDFNINELCDIESAFEEASDVIYFLNPTKKQVRNNQIKGLEAVIKVMMTFDEVEEDVKEVFTKKAELIKLNN